jgi:hypothetical protein
LSRYYSNKLIVLNILIWKNYVSKAKII